MSKLQENFRALYDENVALHWAATPREDSSPTASRGRRLIRSSRLVDANSAASSGSRATRKLLGFGCRGPDVAFGEVAINRRGNEAGLRTAEVILATA